MKQNNNYVSTLSQFYRILFLVSANCKIAIVSALAYCCKLQNAKCKVRRDAAREFASFIGHVYFDAMIL